MIFKWVPLQLIGLILATSVIETLQTSGISHPYTNKWKKKRPLWKLQWKRLCVPAQKHIWSKHVKVTNKCHLSNGSHLDFYQQFLCPPKILIKCLWEFLENSENAKCICKEARSWSENKLKLFWRLNNTKSAIQIALKDIWISASRCWTEH